MSHDVTAGTSSTSSTTICVSGSLPEDRRADFNSHLPQCPSCVAYMKTCRVSIELGRAVLTRSEAPVPEVPEELVRAILATRKKA